ncbi:hypothetical protein Anas_11209 [Armadillidium nasatum]|uniref:Uncharacterized protein n=1 Tax=Armadillidium nasatum TaxID=96803 RepID=A0A5N5SXD4_9CRUS|nr:hypothetical protein Anas_11209 [Armadillidium nasatum]
MPSYTDTFELKASKDSESSVSIHVFDYIDPNVAIPSSKIKMEGQIKSIKKQLICTSPCLFFGTKNLTSLEKEKWETLLQKGQQFEGYFIRTVNGKYDYCYKIWTNRRLPFAPLNYPSPKANKVYDVIIIDKNGDYLGVAAGPHLAFCKIEDMKANDIDVDNLSFPCVGGTAKLVRVIKGKPAEIPYAAYQAVPLTMESQEDEEEEEEEVEPKMEKEGNSGSEEGREEVRIKDEEGKENILNNVDEKNEE